MWDRENRDFSREGEEVTEEQEKKSQDELIEENKHREVYCPDTKKLNFKGQRSTDIRNNPRTKMPDPRSNKEETELQTRATLVMREAKEYISKLECQPTNLTKSERRGLKKLKARIKAEEIVILETDKSKKLCAMSIDIYRELGEVHVKDDPIVEWDDVRDSQ